MFGIVAVIVVGLLGFFFARNFSFFNSGGSAGTHSEIISGDLGVPTEIGYRETLHVDKLSLTFEEIEEDSRCPADVVCIQAGRVVALFTATDETTREVVELASDETSQTILGYQVTLEAVTPQNLEGEEILPVDYRLKITVSR